MIFSRYILCSLVTAFSTAVVASAQNPIVQIDQGTLKGKIMKSRNGREIAAFLKIPYAKPPIKELRLTPPVPADGWDGERDATEDVPDCYQRTNSLDHKKIIIGTEDCLYLNVYTLQIEKLSDNNYPVMVYIHGGSFTSGNSKSTTFGPEYLLDKDVVLVTLNYRVGLLGFMSMENGVLPGNNGLKDQVLALKWVKNNIKNFGGNPDNIALFGESAGAVSVGLHLLSPLSKGLFQRAISESGSPLNFWSISHPGDKKDEANLFAILKGCKKFRSRKTLECLQDLPVEDFILKNVSNALNTFLNGLPYNIGTVVEPKDANEPFLPENPWTLLDKPSDIPWIIGMNSAEGIFIADRAYPKKDFLLDFAGFMAGLDFPFLFGYKNVQTKDDTTHQVKKFYFGDRDLSKCYRDFVQLCTDRAFLQPAIDSVKMYKGPKYFYYYDFLSDFRVKIAEKRHEEVIGPSHGDELVNLFFQTDRTPDGLTGREKEISEAMVEYWTNYAINGSPNSENSKLPKWEPVKSDDVEYLYIGKDKIEMRSGLQKDRYDLWNSFEFKREF